MNNATSIYQRYTSNQKLTAAQERFISGIIARIERIDEWVNVHHVGQFSTACALEDKGICEMSSQIDHIDGWAVRLSQVVQPKVIRKGPTQGNKTKLKRRMKAVLSNGWTSTIIKSVCDGNILEGARMISMFAQSDGHPSFTSEQGLQLMQILNEYAGTQLTIEQFGDGSKQHD